MLAIALSASIFCARVMRGTASIARTVARRLAEPLDERLVLPRPHETDERRALLQEVRLVALALGGSPRAGAP